MQYDAFLGMDGCSIPELEDCYGTGRLKLIEEQHQDVLQLLMLRDADDKRVQ